MKVDVCSPPVWSSRISPPACVEAAVEAISVRRIGRRDGGSETRSTRGRFLAHGSAALTAGRGGDHEGCRHDHVSSRHGHPPAKARVSAKAHRDLCMSARQCRNDYLLHFGPPSRTSPLRPRVSGARASSVPRARLGPQDMRTSRACRASTGVHRRPTTGMAPESQDRGLGP
jgi:hypothetical protein